MVQFKVGMEMGLALGDCLTHLSSLKKAMKYLEGESAVLAKSIKVMNAQGANTAQHDVVENHKVLIKCQQTASRRCKDVDAAVRKLRNELKSLNEHHCEQEHVLSEQKPELDEKEAQLRIESEEIKTQAAQLHKEKAQLTRQKSELRTDRDMLRAERDGLRKDIKRLQAEGKKVRGQQNAMHKKILGLQQRLVDQQMQLDEDKEQFRRKAELVRAREERLHSIQNNLQTKPRVSADRRRLSGRRGSVDLRRVPRSVHWAESESSYSNGSDAEDHSLNSRSHFEPYE